MITYGFFDSIEGDRKYSADQMSSYFDGLVGDGIYESVGQALVITPGTGLSVNIGTGRGIIKCHWINNDTVSNLEVSAHSSLPKWVAIVMRYDKTNRLMQFDAVNGEPAASPDKPTLANTATLKELALAYVYLPAGATSVDAANIEDARSTSGWVTGLIDQLDVSTLYNQWYALFNSYFTDMGQRFDEWFTTLTDQLHVDTYIAKYDKTVTLTDSNVIDLDMIGYNYDSNDALDVFINGLHGEPRVDYTLDASGAVPKITTLATASGTVVEIRIFKSKIGFNPQVDIDGNYVVDVDNNNIGI